MFVCLKKIGTRPRKPIVGPWNKRGGVKLNGSPWREPGTSMPHKRSASRGGAREKERRELEAAQSSLVTRLRIYEGKWTTLRGNDVRTSASIYTVTFV